ncbi:sensor histidine kinase [Parablautia muri]|uniref:histidine kinase n=1 Tax=Parablautia muri TaxID=2320879 RepID=A0A9X5BFW4_9FIRM|nr:HAMP domain-containing sensor histidine kinase [Parablautia muri]NBJ93051.1 sensor histidine kinase [Parablautia muri]
MKLWKKLSMVTVTILSAATLASGAAVIYRSMEYNQRKTIESSERQLKSIAYAIGKDLESGLLQGYSGVTRNSYINFVIKKYGASEYILIEDDQVVCNLTPFELTNPEDERWGGAEICSIIQSRGEQYILISGKKVPVVGKVEYKLVLVQDISELYGDIRKQVYFSLTFILGASVISVVLIFLLTKRIMRPLRELQKAAKEISEGNLTRRANVRTKDEIGAMAEAFNSMAGRIEAQVTELSQVSERRRQMLGSLTHELKTPMTSIIGYSDTLRNVNLKKEQQERALWHIYKECRRLERLSSKLMSLMGLYDNDSICMEEVSMKELFEQVVSLEEYNLKQKGIRLESFCTMGSRQIDRDLFESLLVNLIDNGIKASSEGTVIFLTGQDNRITVRDQGCGIPADEIKRVTEAFYMVDKARSRKAGGCGLGLALCSMIAELHEAKLVIESEVGKGTNVSIIF